ncbi:MAG: hypothetical protein AABW88_04385 [Nanoarchaeota archaeon]|mgnify:CR=1 FL=1
MKNKYRILNLKIQSNKAQLTMFILLGIVIISIFGFVFFTTGQISRQRAEQQAEQIFAEILETTSLKFYVNRCTERALSEGIDLISKQGGRIYPSQGGPESNNYEKIFLFNDPFRDKTYDVGYGILKENTPLPQYPCKVGFTNYDKAPAFCEYSQTKVKFNNMDFGIANLPSLCSNRYGGCTVREGWNPRFSVQSQLEQFISNSTKECVDFGSIIGVNQSYVVEEGNVTANVTFSNTDITAIVNFPIIVSPPASQPVTRLVSFESTYSTNFKQIYGLAREAVVADVSSPAAPTSKFVEKFKSLMKTRFQNNEPFVIVRQGNVSFFDDLIRIVDLTAQPGTETVLQFVMENRPPVLDQIDPYGPYPAVVSEGCSQFDLIAIENQLLTLEPSAFDTDDDSKEFSYSGWLEEYNETIGNEVIDLVSKCVKSYASNKLPYTTSGQIRWMKDLDFENNGKASAFMTPKDIGPHNLRISVCDEQDYCDYQDIRILVDDLIKIAVEPKNKLGTRTFSLEDPYSFTAEITDVYNPGAYAFSWKIKDVSGNILKSYEASDQTLNIPAEYTISNIKEKMQEVVSFIEGETYKISAEVIQAGGYSVSNDTEIVPLQCLPHNNPNVKPYPYNGATDPFLADHACCNTDGTYKPTSSPCYSEITYGSYLSFNSNKYQTPGTPTPLPSNDVFKRTFERKCSGTRGNTCEGPMAESYLAISCQDKTANERATCQGPDKNLLKLNTETSSIQSCIYYDKTTFEKETGQAGFTNSIICNLGVKCTTDNSNTRGLLDSFISQRVSQGISKRYSCNSTCGPYGCTQTLPELCHDCYQDQTCTGTTVPTPNTVNTINVKIYSGCPTTSCTFTTPSFTDGCFDTTYLREWYCTGIKTPTGIYAYQDYDCRYYGEEEANDPDGDIPTATLGQCTSKSTGNCGSNRCNPGTTLTCTDEKSYPEGGKYKIKECIKKNIWPGGDETKKESCSFVTYDYDDVSLPVDVASTLCSTSQFSNGVYGVWNAASRCCKGDDITGETCP